MYHVLLIVIVFILSVFANNNNSQAHNSIIFTRASASGNTDEWLFVDIQDQKIKDEVMQDLKSYMKWSGFSNRENHNLRCTPVFS